MKNVYFLGELQMENIHLQVIYLNNNSLQKIHNNSLQYFNF